jgi:hypothetical protein
VLAGEVEQQEHAVAGELKRMIALAASGVMPVRFEQARGL